MRFDSVYVGHFKCNLRRIIDYPALTKYLNRLLKLFDIADTIDMKFIKRHYYESHLILNSSGIVPIGPENLFPLGC